MKYIYLIIIGFILASILIYGFDRAWDRRCEYYSTLPNITDDIIKYCPNMEGGDIK